MKRSLLINLKVEEEEQLQGSNEGNYQTLVQLGCSFPTVSTYTKEIDSCDWLCKFGCRMSGSSLLEQPFMQSTLIAIV